MGIGVGEIYGQIRRLRQVQLFSVRENKTCKEILQAETCIGPPETMLWDVRPVHLERQRRMQYVEWI